MSLANNTRTSKREVNIRQLFGSQPGWRMRTLPRTAPHIDSELYRLFTDKCQPALCAVQGMYAMVLRGLNPCQIVAQLNGVPDLLVIGGANAVKDDSAITRPEVE
jgi:hypothetical protein